MRGSSTERAANFERRLRETMDSELEPEMVSPNTAAYEEMPDREEVFPLVKQLNQTNGRGRNSGRTGHQSGRGRDAD
jgi:hypothetical protein